MVLFSFSVPSIRVVKRTSPQNVQGGSPPSGGLVLAEVFHNLGRMENPSTHFNAKLGKLLKMALNRLR